MEEKKEGHAPTTETPAEQIELFKCSCCLKFKTRPEFYRNSAYKSGVDNYCIDCRRNYFKEYPNKPKTKKPLKRCASCRKHKDREEFYVNNRLSDGLSSYCKECALSYNSAWRKKNPQKKKYVPKPGQTWIPRNRERWNDYQREYMREYKENNQFRIGVLMKLARKIGPLAEGTKCSCCNSDRHVVRKLDENWLKEMQVNYAGKLPSVEEINRHVVPMCRTCIRLEKRKK